MPDPFNEMVCGQCGGDTWKVQSQGSKGRSLQGRALQDLALVCQGCGSVTHLVPISGISVEWGRPEQGEKDDGILCPGDWKEASHG